VNFCVGGANRCSFADTTFLVERCDEWHLEVAQVIGWDWDGKDSGFWP